MTINKQEIKVLADRVKTDSRFCADEYHHALAEGVLSLLAEISRIEIDAAYVMAGSRTRSEVIDQLKAENEALRSLVLSALEEGKRRPGAGGNAPGHCHAVPGVWDRGNGERSGTACGWCRIWNAARAMVKEANHG